MRSTGGHRFGAQGVIGKGHRGHQQATTGPKDPLTCTDQNQILQVSGS